MSLKVIFFVCVLAIYASNGAVLLWSNNKLEISPLNEFNDGSLEDLVRKLGYPELAIYKSTFAMLPELEGLLSEYHTSYSPNGDISLENATEISGQDDLSLLETKQRLNLVRGDNILSVLVLPNERFKREATSVSSSTETSSTASRPVLYRAKSKNNIYTLLYSSQPLVLRTTDNSSILELGESPMVTVDLPGGRDPYTRLYIKVPVGEDNPDLVILQFIFESSRSYWSLKWVKVSNTTANLSSNLSIVDSFSVPARFSYHCGGATVFSDASKYTELLVYDMQVQIDSKNGAFDDPYDCVDFTTAPIWSGLFVTFLLGVVLMIALTAISEIKTMDKFDTQKTKQLVFTVLE